MKLGNEINKRKKIYKHGKISTNDLKWVKVSKTKKKVKKFSENKEMS